MDSGAGGCPVLPCGYCLKASMTDLAVGLDLFTLAFDSSPIKGEGEYGWFGLFTRTSATPLDCGSSPQ